MNFGEHSAGRSIFGTTRPCQHNVHHIGHDLDSLRERQNALMIPSVGLAESGSVISAFIPQTIVVSPILTNAEPSAVDIDPRISAY